MGWRWFLYGFVLLALLIGTVAPVMAAVAGGLSPRWLAEALAHPLYQQAIVNSLIIASLTTLIAALLAIPLAWLAAHRRFAGQSIAEGLILSPLILPPFVGAIGVWALFGHDGAINAVLHHVGLGQVDWMGGNGRLLLVCVVEALGLFPIMYLNLSAAFARLDPGHLEAARAGGAGPMRAWFSAGFPALRPALFAGASVVFVAAFTDLGTPLLLGYDRCLSVQVFNGLAELTSNPMPLALVVIMLAISTGLYAIARGWLAPSQAADAGRGSARTVAVPLRRWGAFAAWGAFLLVAALAAAPHVAVALTAVAAVWYDAPLPTAYTLDHLRTALGHPLVVPGIMNSLWYSSLATVVAVGLGVTIAWLTTRWKPRGWHIIDGMAMIPLAVPGIVMAFGFLILATAIPALKAWLDPTRNPLLILVIAYAIRRLPLVVRAAAAGFAQAPPAFEEAAAASGARPWQRLRHITLPLIAGSIAAGAVLTFSASMLDVSDSLILAQTRDAYPITKVLYDLTSLLGQGPALACALGLWAMAFMICALTCASVIARKRFGDLFRE